jgi:putative transposase
MPHTYTRLLVHAVFSTKERRPLIVPDLKPRLLAYIGGIVTDLKAKTLATNAVTDHVHLLLSLPATLAVADILRLVKTNSSKWVHDNWPTHEFAWQTGYGAFTVSASNVDQVRHYIANQEEHHRTVSFQEEFLALLTRHGIEYDDRYVWD